MIKTMKKYHILVYFEPCAMCCGTSVTTQVLLPANYEISLDTLVGCHLKLHTINFATTCFRCPHQVKLIKDEILFTTSQWRMWWWNHRSFIVINTIWLQFTAILKLKYEKLMPKPTVKDILLRITDASFFHFLGPRNFFLHIKPFLVLEILILLIFFAIS